MRLKFRAKVNPLILHRCLGSYRLHANSKTVAESDLFQPEFLRVRAEYEKLLTSKEHRQIATKRRSREAEKHRLLAWQALRESDVSAARLHAKETLKRSKFDAESWRVMYCALRGR